MPTVKGVLQKYHEGQNIFRREAVACLVARIEQLEKYIVSQQKIHQTLLESPQTYEDWLREEFERMGFEFKSQSE